MFVSKVYLSSVMITSLLIFATLSVSYQNKDVLLLGTTTSVDNSGVLDYIITGYHQKYPHTIVRVIAKGSGAAIQLARDGEVDAILTHDPVAESQFVSQGFGINYTRLFHNYFLLVGPKQGKIFQSILDAFSYLYEQGSKKSIQFISRGDSSGTHSRELEIWRSLNLTVDTRSGWYRESGSGMAATLRLAGQIGAYTFTDMATFIRMESITNLNLKVVYTGNESLLYNRYSYSIVSPSLHPGRNFHGASSFLSFLLSYLPMILNYRIDGKQVFFKEAN